MLLIYGHLGLSIVDTPQVLLSTASFNLLHLSHVLLNLSVSNTYKVEPRERQDP